MSFREHLTPQKEDEPGFATPSKPSELRTLPDDEFARLVRKLAFDNRWPFHVMVEHEMSARLIASLRDFKQASDRSARILIVLTAVLVVLTIVLVWLTASLD